MVRRKTSPKKLTNLTVVLIHDNFFLFLFFPPFSFFLIFLSTFFILRIFFALEQSKYFPIYLETFHCRFLSSSRASSLASKDTYSTSPESQTIDAATSSLQVFAKKYHVPVWESLALKYM